MVFPLNINFNLSDLGKLFNKKKIDKVYSKIYNLAEGIATHETETYMTLTRNRKRAGQISSKKCLELLFNSLRYKHERLEYHMDRMIKLVQEFNESKGH